MYSNNLVDDDWGRKIVDKVFRLSNKVLTNREQEIDLATGRVIGEGRSPYWYGRDLARVCREEADLYVGVMLNKERNDFRGYKPIA